MSNMCTSIFFLFVFLFLSFLAVIMDDVVLFRKYRSNAECFAFFCLVAGSCFFVYVMGMEKECNYILILLLRPFLFHFSCFNSMFMESFFFFFLAFWNVIFFFCYYQKRFSEG